MDGVLVADGAIVGVIGGVTTSDQRAEQLAETQAALAAEQGKLFADGSKEEHRRLANIARMEQRIAVLQAPPVVPDWPEGAVFEERPIADVQVGDPA